MSQLDKYREEYDKYKDIIVSEGEYRNKEGFAFYISDVDLDRQVANVRTVKSGVNKVKTLHWCRKNLVSNVSRTNKK